MSGALRGLALAIAMVLASLALGPQPALAGCSVKITYKNVMTEDIQTNPYWSKVKIQGGWYKSLKSDSTWITIPAGGEKTRTYTLDLGCNHDRRYKIHAVWRGLVWYTYKPSETGWTRNTEITVRLQWVG